MNPSSSPVLHDRSIRQQFGRRAERINQAEFLLREIEQRMFDRLDLVKLQPDRLLDIGCGRGQGLAVLSMKYPRAFAIGLDFALPMLRHHRAAGGFMRGLMERLPATLKANIGAIAPRSSGVPICANAQQLPLANASIDLLWSNLCWHWLVDPVSALEEWYRVIRPGGLLMFSSFGVDTGRELRELGWPIPSFPDMHDIGDALTKNGFADPVMDSERLTLEYRDAARLMAELSSLAGNASVGRRSRLSTRADKARWLLTLENALQARQGVFKVTIEVNYGHAWCAAHKKLPAGYAPVNWAPANVSRNTSGNRK